MGSSRSYESIDIGVLKGKILIDCERSEFSANDGILFVTNAGERFILSHEQDCCESVNIESIDGDLNDLVGSEILMAETWDNNHRIGDGCGDSETWTFIKFATIKGYVTVRFYGKSNGYYSESAGLYRKRYLPGDMECCCYDYFFDNIDVRKLHFGPEITSL